MNVDVIIPTRNERDNIAILIPKIQRYGYNITVVDDSNDDTAEVAKNAGAKVLKGRGLGLAQAVLDGIDAAKSEYVIVMDADLQHPPQLLPRIVKRLEYHDLVVVTKHSKGAKSSLSLWRKLQSNAGVWLSKILVPVPVSDPMSGYFGIRRECIDGLPRGEYYKFDQKKIDEIIMELPEQWNDMPEEEQNKWYCDNGMATQLIGLEGIGFKIGLELFAKAKWVSHCELPMKFANRQSGVSKGTAHSLHKHLGRLYKNSLNYVTELPKGSEEYHMFYEGTDWQQKWKKGIAWSVFRSINKLRPEYVLDAGCGSSPNINYMRASCVQKRVGMDINEKAIAYMRSHSDADFVPGDVTNIPFSDASFDMVTCIEVLEHLYSNDIDKAIAEIVRVLKPSGYAIIATPNYSSALWNIIEKSQQVIERGAWTSDHHTKFTRKSLRDACVKHGLHEIAYDSVINNADMIVTFQKINHGG
jgi:dolichol-phosphate mannosyltransferase